MHSNTGPSQFLTNFGPEGGGNSPGNLSNSGAWLRPTFPRGEGGDEGKEHVVNPPGRIRSDMARANFAAGEGDASSLTRALFRRERKFRISSPDLLSAQASAPP